MLATLTGADHRKVGTVDTTRVAHDDRHDHDEAKPHGCYRGFVYIGHMVEGEDGEEVEVFEAVPCRRCEDER